MVNTSPNHAGSNAAGPIHRFGGDHSVDVHGQQGAMGGLIRYALSLVRRNLLPIAGIVGSVLVLAVVVTVLDTPSYTATTTVQINDQSDQVLGAELDSSLSNESWDTDRFLNTQIGILRSRGLAIRVAQKLDLFGNQAFFTAMGSVMPDGTSSKEDIREAVVGMLSGKLIVDLPQSTRMATISFISHDPAVSARVANAFADEFIQSNLQRRYDSSAYARNFVAEQLEESRARLEGSERELNAYARQAGLIRTRDLGGKEDSANGAGSVTAASLMQLNEAANTAQAQRVTAEGRWNAES